MPSFTVIRKPNQLGLELSHGTGSITLSSISASAALNLSKLCLLLSTNEGNFSSCAQPTAVCISVALRLYPKCEYTYLWSYPNGSSPYCLSNLCPQRLSFPDGHTQSRPQSLNERIHLLRSALFVYTAPPSPIVI